MDKILIISGKGGAGKSMLTSALISFLHEREKVIGVDADVDAPDLAVWLNLNEFEVKKEIYEAKRVNIKKQPVLKPKAVDLCPHRAIRWKKARVNYLPYLCEGCGLCSIINPEIFEMVDAKNGEIREYKGKYRVIEGHLLPGFTGSGKIVTDLIKFSEGYSYELMIIDGAPGTGCPVNAALREANKVIFVVEETINGVSDFYRTLEVVEHFNKPYWIVINKHGLNDKIHKKLVEEFNVLGAIPYSMEIFKCALKRINVFECKKELINDVLEKIYAEVINQ